MMLRNPASGLLVLTFLAFSACSCDTVPMSRSSGVLALIDSNVDFGLACIDATVERPFVIANHGSGTLNIVSIEFSSEHFGLLEDAPQSLGPGEELVLRLGFTPPKDGRHSGSVTIVSDAPEDETQVAPLFGEGFAGKERELKVTCTEDAKDECYSVDLDNVLVGHGVEKTIYISNLGCESLRVNEAYFHSDQEEDPMIRGLDLSESAPFELRGGETMPLDVLYMAPREPGTLFAKLVLKSDDPEVKDTIRGWEPGEFQLGVFANIVRPDLQTDPDLLTFYDSAEGQTVEKTFKVINNGNSDLEVLDVELIFEEGNKDYTLKLIDGASRFTLPGLSLVEGENEREVTVSYTSSGPGPARARVEVKGELDTATVRLVGGTEPTLVVNWLDPEDGQWKIPPVNFGETETGAKAIERQIRVSNTGRADLKVSSLDLAESTAKTRSYTVSKWSGTLKPEQSHDLSVRFDDNVLIRNDQDQLAIASNDPLHALNDGIMLVDLISRNTPNHRPVVIIRANTNSPNVGEMVELDGSETTGPEEGDTLTFQWSVLRQPDDGFVKLESPNQPITRVISEPPNASKACPSDVSGNTCPWPYIGGQYVFQLQVTDQFGNEGQATQIVNVYEP